MKVYCYFHNDDLDGWSSSAVVKRKHPDAEFHISSAVVLR